MKYQIDMVGHYILPAEYRIRTKRNVSCSKDLLVKYLFFRQRKQLPDSGRCRVHRPRPVDHAELRTPTGSDIFTGAIARKSAFIEIQSAVFEHHENFASP